MRSLSELRMQSLVQHVTASAYFVGSSSLKPWTPEESTVASQKHVWGAQTDAPSRNVTTIHLAASSRHVPNGRTGLRFQLSKINCTEVTLDGVIIPMSSEVKLLGVALDVSALVCCKCKTKLSNNSFYYTYDN